METPYYQDYLAYKKECEKLQLLLKMRDEEVKQYRGVINAQREDIERLQNNVKELTAVAESWQKDYDELKEKYEPTYFTTSDSSGAVCPKCGTTEMLCGYNGVGCDKEKEDES